MTHQENIISAQIDGGLHEKQALLDDFAKAALTGLITNEQNFDYLREKTAGLLAKDAYDIATALMQERERRMKG